MENPIEQTDASYTSPRHNKSTNIKNLGSVINESVFKGNIENYIGLCAVPIGKAGPLLIKGTFGSDSLYVPLATTEGALVASYNRGIKAGRMSGGFTTHLLECAVQRTPLFKFKTAKQAIAFGKWIVEKAAVLKTIAESSSQYTKLIDIKPHLEGNELILELTYTTGDASGQNMVTIASQQVCNFAEQYAPIKAEYIFIEGNASGDKKLSFQALNRTRGKKVIAEVQLPNMVVQNILKSTPKNMVRYWQSSTLAQIKVGAVGNQGHIANGLAAMFLATGQDIACISEAAQGINRMEVTETGDLYASLTLNNLIVGSVGGGTDLPTQKECLEMMDCYGVGKANKLAEIMSAVALAGELSIAAAIAEGHFTQAHQTLGRK